MLKEIDIMDQAGIWEPIKRADWVHQLVAVPKPNGDVRLMSDLSPLNPLIVPVRYPLPMFEDLKLKLGGAKVYSKLNLRKGFFHVQLAENSHPLTATMTPKGLRQYMRLPMGATNSGAVFQRCWHGWRKRICICNCTNVTFLSAKYHFWGTFSLEKMELVQIQTI